ncbi:MAG: PDZ domain-containing protein [Verrucomicrobiales bacterium]|nr:PDZ domain-containing protein [Verrucomicrobiales bacterium]
MKTLFSILLLATFAASALAQQPRPAKGKPSAPKPAAAPPALNAAPGLARDPIIKTQSLLKVNVTSQAYNVHLPWQKESPSARRGLGVVMPQNHVLVTAQMVADATYIELEQPESGRKLPARVTAVDYEANVALLQADSTDARTTEFFKDLQPMQLDTGVRIGDALSVWQIGQFGDLIVTPMRISKVETARYFVDGSVFLVYEGAGIVRSEGNSFTLPVVKGGKLAGLLLRYDSKNQVTTVLPASIIEHFLKDSTDGKYDGFPNLGVEFQITLDEQFREYLGMKPGAPGIYVGKVSKGGSAAHIGLKEGDILTAINGFRIDSRGNYKDPQYGTLSISHIVRGKAYVGDPVTIKVMREGEPLELKGELIRKRPEDEVVTPYRFDRGPNYILAGGLLFQELNDTYLDAFGEDRRSGTILRLSHIAQHPEAFEKEGRKKIIFLSLVLPTPSCQGYERLGGQIVNKVNGQVITDLQALKTALEKPKDGVHAIQLGEFPHLIYLDDAAMKRDDQGLINGSFRVGSLERLE